MIIDSLEEKNCDLFEMCLEFRIQSLYDKSPTRCMMKLQATILTLNHITTLNLMLLMKSNVGRRMAYRGCGDVEEISNVDAQPEDFKT